ncbi:Uncharacterised protein [Mycobacteroides abscessus subsp. bolletii]|uniref:hypothetical protein n=1 Tax=Mycobacteroides abscessus TaxID=36809 RepID=UPI00092C3B74|nr:hypothetical protein [Mycobacteroides abscessus]MDM2104790.1 hypothetical protein [Mycobacteroides abscessus]MDM2133622.1 hypothetical protein [Mycobacteroides abscessus]MDM2142646.1 hypothetical protein [Mycobacteroides abscessus]MDM2153748.1 hypothetical protein [Mycobacteroides abscessus]MDM2182781.1 hypothetical protein [Mycobacteroides abscessus]
MSNDSYGFLSGGGAPSAKFKTHGDTVGGVIVEEPTQQQQRDLESGDLETWPDGNPKMQLVVTVQTDLRDPAVEDDDGKRRIFVKGGLRKAVQEAVIAAGSRGLDVGGELHVTYTGDGERKGYLTAPKLYSARYVKPSESAAPAAEELPEGVSPEAYEALKKLGKVK